METIGPPPQMLYKLSRRKDIFFEPNGTPILHPNERGKVKTPGEKPIKMLMEKASPDFIDFVEKCIEWQVPNRITPEKAFDHPWIAEGVRLIREENNSKAKGPAAPTL